MRFVLLAALVLSGCSASPEKIPVQPAAPTRAENISKVAAQLDRSDAAVAAAVTVARENAGKPEVVKAESDVALAYLPKPSDAEVALARQRALKADQKEYAEAVAYGKKLLAQIDINWAKMEADQKEAARISKLKDDRIAALTAEVEKVKKEASANLWTMAGVGCALIGALSTALVSPKIGIPLLACGAAIGAFPFVIDSPYFTYIAGGSIAVASSIGLWYLWDVVRDKVNAKPIDDEQATPKV